MVSGSCITRRSPCVNTPANPDRELDELDGTQGSARESNVGSDEALTEAYTLLEAPISTLIPPPTKDLFTKFMKVFIKTMQAWDQEHLEPQERLLKAKTPETYSGKSHMDCYYFCQQCEDYFETSGATGINRISFAANFLRGTVSLRWA